MNPERSRRLIGLLSGRWTLGMLAQLTEGGRRYQDLHEGLDGITHKVLTETLRRAERDGLIVRLLDDGRVDTPILYQLTEVGRSLDEPLAAIERWLEGNWPKVEDARNQWERRANTSQG